MTLLYDGGRSDITEFAAAGLGDLAAGGQDLKDAIREVVNDSVVIELRDPLRSCLLLA